MAIGDGLHSKFIDAGLRSIARQLDRLIKRFISRKDVKHVYT